MAIGGKELSLNFRQSLEMASVMHLAFSALDQIREKRLLKEAYKKKGDCGGYIP